MTKLYCSNCKYFDDGDQLPFYLNQPHYDNKKELCLAPQNFKDSHRIEKENPISGPWVINRFNDCVWYEELEVAETSSSSSQ
jgi:hypothetical protein